MWSKWTVLGLLLLFGASNTIAYSWGVSNHTLVSVASSANLSADEAKTQTNVEVKERQVEQAAQAAVNEVSSYAFVDQSELVSALAIANGTAERLRNELQATRDNLNGTGSYASLAERSASATRASMVLSELYGGCQSRLTEIAGAFDQAYSRGLTCSTTYNKVRKLLADGG